MHSIVVKRFDGISADDVSVLALDIATSSAAWDIAEHIAASYEEHGVDRNGPVYWFRSAAGLHHIWVEQSCADGETFPPSSPDAAVLVGAPRSAESHGMTASRQAA